MSPQELNSEIAATREWLAALPPSSKTDEEEWDPTPDFWEAIELMEISLRKLELCCKLDIELKFLTRKERRDLMKHTAEIMTFLDLYTNEEDKNDS